MLGPFYGKVWDSDRQTRQSQHFSHTPFSTTQHHAQTRRKRRSWVESKMHLHNGEHVVRFGGVQEEYAEAKVQPNGTVQTQEHGSQSNGDNGAVSTNGQPTTVNEVHVSLPDGLSTDEVLDTVLTAWTLLIQRYQRDVFHQFTWGNKDAGTDWYQCIPSSDLNMQKQSTGGSLKSKISDLRSKDLLNEASDIFLNDGTKDEVSNILDVYIRRLTISSGLLKSRFNSDRARFTLPHNGSHQQCLDTKPFHNFTSLLIFLIPFSATLIARR